MTALGVQPDITASTAGRTVRRTMGVVAVAAVAAVTSAVGRLPVAVVAPVMMLLLAGIDIAGAVVAKSWSQDRTPWLFAVGAGLFVLLFWVYGVSLSYGHLSTITLGWVVLVTTGSFVLDATLYDVHLPMRKWLAAVVLVGLLIYLMTDDGAAHDGANSRDGAARPTVGTVDDLRTHVDSTPS